MVLSVRTLSHAVRRDNQIVPLTTSPFERLRVLIESAAAAVRREDLSKNVFDRESRNHVSAAIDTSRRTATPSRSPDPRPVSPYPAGTLANNNTTYPAWFRCRAI